MSTGDGIAPTTGGLDFSRNPVQAKFMACTAPFQCYAGGFGSGKTTACCAKAILCGLLMPGNCWAILRHTYPDLRDSTQKVFFETLNKMAGVPEWTAAEDNPWVRSWSSAKNDLVLKNGSEYLFRHFEENKVKVGANLGGFFIDQAEEATEEIFNGLVGRCRRQMPRRYGIIAMNPNGMDWQYRLFAANKADDYRNFDSTTHDNARNLPADYIPNLLKRFPQDWIERFVYGKWSTMSGLIFHEFDDDLNTCEHFDVPREWPKVRGLDWGVDAPATCVPVVQAPDGNIYWPMEYGDNRKTAMEHAVAILSATKPLEPFRANILDASAFHQESDLKSVADQYGAAKLVCRPATKDQLARIMLVKTLLKSRRLQLFRGHTDETIREMKSWKWAAPKSGQKHEIPARGNDHYLDAGGYATYWLHNKRYEAAEKPAQARADRQRAVLTINQAAMTCDAVTGIPCG